MNSSGRAETREQQRPAFVTLLDSASSWQNLITDSCLASKESPSVICEGASWFQLKQDQFSFSDLPFLLGSSKCVFLKVAACKEWAY